MGQGLLGNSSVPNYVKITATAVLGSTYLSALAVATDVYISQGPQAQLPAIVTFILGTGLSMALGVLGLHQGASLAETIPPTAPATTVGGGSDASTPAA